MSEGVSPTWFGIWKVWFEAYDQRHAVVRIKNILNVAEGLMPTIGVIVQGR